MKKPWFLIEEARLDKYGEQFLCYEPVGITKRPQNIPKEYTSGPNGTKWLKFRILPIEVLTN